MMRLAAFVFALLLAGPAAAQQVADLPTRPGVTVRVLAVPPSGRPSAAAILFTGGSGAANIPDRPGPGWGGNFLVRTRALFAARGVYAVVIDAPSDHRGGLGAFRITEEHAQDIAAVVAEVKRRVPNVPVWLIGTSNGTMSAADGGARLPPGTIAGIVLTSTVTRAGRPTSEGGGTSVLNVDLARIRVPVLLVHHRDDACVASPYSGAESLRGRLGSSPRVELIGLSGGDSPRSGPCDPFAAHGFLGIEDQAVGAIVGWMTQR
jgi:pimeloyl-ACP methyl ester carboxylesterase